MAGGAPHREGVRSSRIAGQPTARPSPPGRGRLGRAPFENTLWLRRNQTTSPSARPGGAIVLRRPPGPVAELGDEASTGTCRSARGPVQRPGSSATGPPHARRSASFCPRAIGDYAAFRRIQSQQSGSAIAHQLPASRASCGGCGGRPHACPWSRGPECGPPAVWPTSPPPRGRCVRSAEPGAKAAHALRSAARRPSDQPDRSPGPGSTSGPGP